MNERISAIYEGQVSHHRQWPRSHGFSYPLFMMYLDLEELPNLFDDRWWWSARRPALAWFRRQDFLGPVDLPLDESVRLRVEESCGRRPEGPIRLLTHLRYWGQQINPVSFYYCHRADATIRSDGSAKGGAAVEAIVAEITNTPWGERYSYVLTEPEEVVASSPEQGPTLGYRMAKDFHVSPFMPMQQEYVWHFTMPGERLRVHMENWHQEVKIFNATLNLERRQIDRHSLSRVLWRHPWMATRVGFWIYLQAFRLWRKRVPFHPHPKTLTDVSVVPNSGDRS